MPEVHDEFGEYERKEVWRNLVEIEKEIYRAQEIDKSGSDFLANEEQVRQARVKNGWYEKWAEISEEDRKKWAREYEVF